jgi:hypothetical protein
MVEGAGGGDVEEEDVGGVAYADHACFVGGDGTVVYGDGEFDCSVTFPFIDIPDFHRVVVVPVPVSATSIEWVYVGITL